MKKRIWLFLILLMLVFNIIPITLDQVQESNHIASGQVWDVDYKVVGDTVFFDNQYANISCCPHTIDESGWIYVNATSKVFSGDVDFVLGVNSSYMNPKNPEISIG